MCLQRDSPSAPATMRATRKGSNRTTARGPASRRPWIRPSVRSLRKSGDRLSGASPYQRRSRGSSRATRRRRRRHRALARRRSASSRDAPSNQPIRANSMPRPKSRTCNVRTAAAPRPQPRIQYSTARIQLEPQRVPNLALRCAHGGGVVGAGVTVRRTVREIVREPVLIVARQRDAALLRKRWLTS